MKTTRILIYFVAVVFLFITQSAQAQRGVWKQLNDIGATQPNAATARSNSVSFSIGNKAYLGLGTDWTLKKDFWAYDLNANSWSQITDFLGGKRIDAVAFSIAGIGYVGTGADTNFTGLGLMNDFWAYDPVSNTWTQKASFPGIKRAGAVGFSIGNYGYIGTGYDSLSSAGINDFWRYDPSNNTWTQMANFGGSGRSYAVGFSIGNMGYIGMGKCTDSVNEFWQYNPTTNVWTRIADFPGTSLRFGAVGIGTDSFGVVGTGYDIYYAVYKDEWKYTPSNNTWTQLSSFDTLGRVYATGFNIDSTVYVGGGIDGAGARSCEISKLNNFSGTWSRITNLGARPRSAAQSFTINNKGYICGGACVSGLGNDVWEYDPFSGLWTEKARCAGTFRTEGVGFSLNNMGYLCTGLTTYFDSSNHLWQYDPTSDSWTQKDNFPGTAISYGIAINMDNKEYVGTGEGGGSFSLSDIYSYDPITNLWGPNISTTIYTESASAFNIGNQGYIACGYDNGCGSGVVTFDSTFYWTQLAPTIPARYNGIAFVLNQKAYIGLGRDCNNNRLKDVYEYDPISGTINRIADFPGGQRELAVAFSIGNMGYVGSGSNGIETYSDFWSFNPNSCFADSQMICLVTTDTTLQSPIIAWDKVNKYATQSFYIYRANTPDTSYTNIAIINRDSLSLWEDTSAHTDQRSYRYKIAVQDSCGFLNDQSPYHQTIYLTSLGSGQFTWTPYTIENNSIPIGNYYLYRDSLGTGNWQILQTLSNTQTTASDPSYALYPNARYMVVIVLSNPCTPSRSLSTITSNILSNTNTGIIGLSADEVKIIPNPAHNQVTMGATGMQAISITDVLGQQVYQNSGSNNSVTIPLEQWKPGLYFYLIQTNKSSYRGTLVKE